MSKILILLLLLSIRLTHAASLDEIITTISSECPQVNRLVIKKSLIELHNSKFCSSTFTTLLLNKCNKLNCSELISHSESLSESNSGSIIGR